MFIATQCRYTKYNSFLEEKNANFNLGIFKTQGGGLHFSKMSELSKRLRPNPREKNKTLYFPHLTPNRTFSLKTGLLTTTRLKSKVFSLESLEIMFLVPPPLP